MEQEGLYMGYFCTLFCIDRKLKNIVINFWSLSRHLALSLFRCDHGGMMLEGTLMVWPIWWGTQTTPTVVVCWRFQSRHLKKTKEANQDSNNNNTTPPPHVLHTARNLNEFEPWSVVENDPFVIKIRSNIPIAKTEMGKQRWQHCLLKVYTILFIVLLI